MLFMMVLRNILQRKQVYNSVRDTPMSVFIDVICGLREEPKNWDKIFNEYQELSKDGKSNLILNMLKEIHFKENQVFLIRTLCYSIAQNYSKEIAVQLSSFIPRFTFTNAKTFAKEIKATLSTCKSILIQVADTKAKLKEMQKENKKPTPQDWDIQFVYLTKFMGVKMTAKNTTISEYINALNMVKESTKDNGK